MVRTSLEIAYPEISAEWHPVKNGELLPSQVGYGSNKKVWWLGSCNHEWQAKISNRVFDNNKCPYCSGRYPIVGENDLATTDPDVAAEWHPTRNGALTPRDVKRSTEKKVWWLGTCGHEWSAIIGARTGKLNTGCPYCSNQKVLIGYNDLQSRCPEIAMEWHPTKNKIGPTEVVYGSSKKAWWLCDVCGHEWSTHIVSRVRNGYSVTGCPICNSGTSTSLPEQAILYYLENAVGEIKHRTCDEIGMELDIYIPSLNVAIEYDGIYWHKNKNNNDKIKTELCNINQIRLIRIRKNGLPEIDGGEVIWRDGFDDESLNVVLMQLFKMLAIKVDVNISRDKLKIYSRYKYDRKLNSLEVKNPQIAAEWHPIKNSDLKPTHVNVRASMKVWWLGKCGHEWEAAISSRTGKTNVGCPYCSNVKVNAGVNDILTTHPQAFDDWDYELNKIMPSEVTYGSGKKIFRRCKNNHSWKSTVKDMINGRGCPYCANKIVLKGYNDLATIYPEIAEEWHPTDNGTLMPSDIMAGSSKKVTWLGKCGHEWKTSIYSRTAKRTGCPFCSRKKNIYE